MNGSSLVLIGGGIFLIWLLFKLFAAPIKIAVKLLLHALLGFVTLFLVNFFGSVIGINIPLTWPNALITGLFGAPGVIVLILLQLF